MVSLPLLPALGSRVAALPDTVTVSLVDTDTSILASAELDLSTLSFALDPYVPGAVTDLSDLTPSALHALIALLEDVGHDATDPAVLSAVDSAYGVYIDSILGSARTDVLDLSGRRHRFLGGVVRPQADGRRGHRNS